MDSLWINGLEVWARVGCTSAERAFPQKILVDLRLDLPLAAAGRRDDLKATVDYAAVAKRLKTLLERRTFRLIEAMAEAAAADVLKEKSVEWVGVKVWKRVLPGIESAAVVIERGR